MAVLVGSVGAPITSFAVPGIFQTVFVSSGLPFCGSLFAFAVCGRGAATARLKDLCPHLQVPAMLMPSLLTFAMLSQPLSASSTRLVCSSTRNMLLNWCGALFLTTQPCIFVQYLVA